MDKQGEWDILEQKLNTEIHDLEELVEHERLSASEQQKLDSKKWQQEVVVRISLSMSVSGELTSVSTVIIMSLCLFSTWSLK